MEALDKRVRFFFARTSKMKSECEKPRNGDLVYLTDDNVAPLQWPLGRITKVYSGPDKFVRVVKVKTLNSIFNRPVAKLRKLLSLNDRLEKILDNLEQW